MARLSSDEQRWGQGDWVGGELIPVSLTGWGRDQVRTVEWARVGRVQISSTREAAAAASELGGRGHFASLGDTLGGPFGRSSPVWGPVVRLSVLEHTA